MEIRYQTLPGSYDYGLVVLSVLIAILASYTALDLAGRVTVSRGRARLVGLTGSAFRHDQCVEPSFGPSLIAASTLACSFGVLTEGFCPGCRSSISPRDTILPKPFLPPRNRGSRSVQKLLNLLIRNAVGKQQNGVHKG
jgi:hypothetical protein